MRRAPLALAIGTTAALHYRTIQHILPSLDGALPAQLLSYLIPPLALLLALFAHLAPPPVHALPLPLFALLHAANLPRLTLALACFLPCRAALVSRAHFLATLAAFLAALALPDLPPLRPLLRPPAPLPPALLVALLVLQLARRSVPLRALLQPRPPRPRRSSKRRRPPVRPAPPLPPLAQALILLAALLAARHLVAPAGVALVRRLHPRPLPSGTVLLAQQRSLTGLISVVELTGQYRMMTADASVLGGLHVRPGYDHDSIFSQFYVHEAVRLARLPGEVGVEGGREGRALCIGLGVGVVANGLYERGSLVDVVEIDPLVVQYAQRFFGFKVPNVFVEDALLFLERALKKGNDARVYDYVIHDVFTGGAVPLDLFSLQTFRNLEAVMKEDGVLAVNYVGMLDDPLSPGTRSVAVVHDRLASVFKHVAAFGDGDDSRLHNIVFFASNVPERLTFRKPLEADFGDSGNRAKALTSFQNYRIRREELGGKIGPIESSDWFLHMGQWETARIHLKLMRSIHSVELWRALLAHEAMG